MGASLTDFVGVEVRGNSLVLRVLKHHPVRRDDHYREVVVPLAELTETDTGSHPALEARNGGLPLPFKILVRRWRVEPGQWQYDIGFGDRPPTWDAAPGTMSHDAYTASLQEL